MKYIHELKNWPNFSWDSSVLASLVGTVRNRQGRLMGKMETMGFELRTEAILKTLSLEIIKSSEIEGEHLDADKVRSSIARRLGLDIGGLVPSDRYVDGVVEMMMDATTHFDKALTRERLFGWHACLFPTGRSGMHKIKVGAWRDDKRGPMQVISGPMGRERIHFEAPKASRLGKEMSSFLKWFNHKPSQKDKKHKTLDPVLKASLAHLWFVTIHPFDDGNGRIARSIAEMQLARSDGSKERFYSMSVQIREEREHYYQVLEQTQKSKNICQNSIDITNWHEWFLNCLNRAFDKTEATLSDVIRQARFWDRYSHEILNERQREMLRRLLSGFQGKLTSSKWAKIMKCSQDTAIRDIQDLMEKGILEKDAAGGRSTSYSLQ